MDDNQNVICRLKKIREMRGISAAVLARGAGVRRQTIYAIESGGFSPNTAIALQLARVLDVAVEEIFSMGDSASDPVRVQADLLAPDARQRAPEGGLVRLCCVGERTIAVPASCAAAYLPAADGAIAKKSRHSVSVETPTKLPESGKRLLLAGCDPALSVLGELLAGAGIEMIAIPCSSRRALAWLKQGRVHAAGTHLLDHASGEYNVPIVNRLFRRGAVRVVTFASWEEGLVVRRGNPKAIRSIADLCRKNVAIVNREKGSGSRDLLDKGLRTAGIAARAVSGYGNLASGHLAAAGEVVGGAADCCIANRSAARCYGLEFVPLNVERFDLVFAHSSLDLAAARAALDLLNRAVLRNKLQAVAGYDTQRTGAVLV
ncbi:MAG: substrate-binding domain-containing protein [Bryobacteraceae bacterium]